MCYRNLNANDGFVLSLSQTKKRCKNIQKLKEGFPQILKITSEDLQKWLEQKYNLNKVFIQAPKGTEFQRYSKVNIPVKRVRAWDDQHFCQA